MGIVNGELHIWANKTRGPGVLCHAKPMLRVSVSGLLSLGPLPFSIQYDTPSRPSMQATGRPPQICGQGSQGQGEEARRGGLRWYPECTQKGYPHCPSPPAQNSALTISCSSPIHSYCSVHAGQTCS